MTHRASAGLAGFLFLLYIAVAMPSMFLYQQVTSGEGTVAKLANVAAHVPQMRLLIVLSLVMIVIALALAVALYAITRDVDPELARIALFCRAGEGLLSAVPILAALALLWLAAGPADAAAQAVGALLLKVRGWSESVSAILFAAGSTIFAVLFVRGRVIPLPLAWLGVVASVVVVIALPLQLIGVLRGGIDWFLWLPMLVFEVVLGFWLLIKGAQPMRKIVPVVLFLFVAPAVAAGDQPLVTHNQYTYQSIQKVILRTAELMPEEKYGYRPADSVRTFGQILGHVADANYAMCSAALGSKSPALQIEKTKTAKGELMTALKEAFAYCGTAYEGLTDASAAQQVRFMGQNTPKLGVLTINQIHTIEHYGNLVTYMRMNGLVPPTSDQEFLKSLSPR